MCLFPALLDILYVFPEVHKRLILIVLAGNIRAEAAEFIQLVLHFFGGSLDVGPDALEVLFVVHFCPSIANNLDILGEETIPVLFGRINMSESVATMGSPTRPKSAGN